MRQAHWGWIVTVVTLVMAASTPALAEVVITHDRVDCVAALSFPVIRARLEPPGEVARARVYFQARGTTHWYYVEMKSQGDVAFAGTLPRPLKSLRSFNYYIETLGPAFAQGRSQEYSAQVVGESESCPTGMTKATASGSAPSALLVSAPPGAPPVPPGFSGLGLVTSVGGSAASAAGAGAAGTGGISTGLLVGIGAAAAAGVAWAVGSGKDESAGGATAPTRPGAGGTPTPQPTPTPTPAPDVTGRWSGQFVERPSTTQCSTTSDLVLNLQQSGSAVSGTFQLAIRSATPAPADPCPVDPGDVFTGPLSGVVNGDTISLQLQITGGPTFFLSGTISGNRIAGTSPQDAEGPGGSWDVTRQ